MMNYDFTAKMEEKLDKIAIGKLKHTKMLSDFWKKFKKYIETAQSGEKIVQKVGRKCSKC